MTVPTITTPVFDHLSVGAESLDRAAAFYDAALAPLGYVRLWRSARAAGYGPEGFEGEAPFALIEFGPGAEPPAPGLHIAFIAPSRQAVEDFHTAALSAGGVDEGEPGIRENYDPGYYAAFVRDPDGHRIEAVLHEQPASDRPAQFPAESLPNSIREAIATAQARRDDVTAQIAAAYALDRSGQEKLAVEFYDAAWRLGVPSDARAEFVIGYGSTLRNVGRTDEAESLLATALREDPGNHAARCFYGLALHSAGRHASALAELLEVALSLHHESPHLTRYRRALVEYRDELRNGRPS